jgi:hypothetical protein
VPRLSSSKTNGKLLDDERERLAASERASKGHAKAYQLHHSLPPVYGGPPTFCDHDAAYYASRGLRAEALLDHEATCLQFCRQPPRGARLRAEVQGGEWLRLMTVEHSRRERLQAAAARRLSQVNADMARVLEHSALDRAMHGQPVRGTVEDCIRGVAYCCDFLERSGIWLRKRLAWQCTLYAVHENVKTGLYSS